jgi:hypothetical protein
MTLSPLFLGSLAADLVFLLCLFHLAFHPATGWAAGPLTGQTPTQWIKIQDACQRIAG